MLDFPIKYTIDEFNKNYAFQNFLIKELSFREIESMSFEDYSNLEVHPIKLCAIANQASLWGLRLLPIKILQSHPFFLQPQRGISLTLGFS